RLRERAGYIVRDDEELRRAWIFSVELNRLARLVRLGEHVLIDALRADVLAEEGPPLRDRRFVSALGEWIPELELARVRLELPLGELCPFRIERASTHPLFHQHRREELHRALFRVRRRDQIRLEQV